MFLNTPEWKEFTKKIRTYLELNDNKNIPYNNLWDAAKTGLRKKIITKNPIIRNKL